jgi:glycerate kinase
MPPSAAERAAAWSAWAVAQQTTADSVWPGRWTALHRLSRIVRPKRSRLVRRCLVATDVQNQLLGARGATRVYGPQKGMRAEDFALAERCLRRLARVAEQEFGLSFACYRGAGAAGGLGFGLLAFLGAELRPGFELFARYAGLERRLAAADVVVTGEGAIDPSTLMGKGVGELARRCRRLRIPCIGLAGTLNLDRGTARYFAESRALTERTSVRQARIKAAYWLGRLAREVAGQACSLEAT